MSTVRIQVRRGTAAQWTAADPVLEAGEIGFESDTNLFKFGNGDDAWDLLPYAAADYTAFQNTLDDYLTVGLRGTANGVASLNSSGKVPDNQINTDTYATRTLVRATVSGLQLHENVTYATTSELTATYAAGTTDWFGGTAIGARLTLNATGVLTVDGVAMPAGARILVKDQANKLHNGLYTVTTAGATGVAAVLTRTDDAADEFSPALYGGSIVYVQLGSSNAGKQFVQLTKGTAANKGIIVGTDNIDWTQYSGAATLTAGTGISISGDTVSLNATGLTLTNTTLSGTLDVPNGSILNADLAADAVTEDKIANGAVTLNKIADVAITAAKIADGTITTAKLVDNVITESKITNLTITGAKLAEGTIENSKIANGTILNAKIASDAAIDWTKIAPSSTVSATELGYLDGVTSAIQAQIDAKAASANPTFTGTVSGVTKSMVGLGDVDNTADSAKPVSTATQTALDAKAALAGPTFTGTVTIPTLAVTTTATGITKTMVGLENVDNTTDAGKPVSTATQTALDLKANLSGATFTGAISGTSLTLSGDLTVNGTTTTLNSTTMSVDDKNIELGSVASPSDVTADGGGITLKGATDKTFNWVDATDSWTSSEHINLASGKDLKVNGTAVISSTAGGFIFTDGTQTKEGTPSRTPIIQKTDSYTLSELTERDSLIEVAKASATTITIPLNSAVAFPVGTSLDILQTSTGQVTIAGTAGVTVNATPGLKLRTQWSSATLFKRAENTWVVIGDLSA
jgi:hypothetical protein